MAALSSRILTLVGVQANGRTSLFAALNFCRHFLAHCEMRLISTCADEAVVETTYFIHISSQQQKPKCSVLVWYDQNPCAQQKQTRARKSYYNLFLTSC